MTLTGPGGVGKTRLALEAAARRAGDHAHGAWVAELAALSDAEALAQTVAATLELDLRAGDAAPQALARHLADRDLLLVLDNCEHLLGAVADLARTLLATCPGVRLLATSRAPLHLPGEVDWRVPSLRLADPEALPELEALEATDAVRLFCERARAATGARFELTAANARAVADVCWRVDGLPLAIELAAARVASLSPAQIADRLGDALRVLRAARPGGVTRREALEATLDWSHDLLTEDERRLFRRLAVFAGGFDLDAAEAVAEADELELASLVDQSLVLAEDGDGCPGYRYRLLEPIRQYAAARLSRAGEEAALAERHARRYARLAAAPGGAVTDLDPEQIRRLEREHDNLRKALGWTLAHDPRPHPGWPPASPGCGCCDSTCARARAGSTACSRRCRTRSRHAPMPCTRARRSSAGGRWTTTAPTTGAASGRRSTPRSATAAARCWRCSRTPTAR